MKVKPEQLRNVAKEILKGFHATDEECRLVAESLVRADMRGIDTHGVHFLTLLANRVDAGMIKIPTRLEVLKDEGATALIDGGDGLGQVAGHRAMEMSIQKAREFGIGTVACPEYQQCGYSHLLHPSCGGTGHGWYYHEQCGPCHAALGWN